MTAVVAPPVVASGDEAPLQPGGPSLVSRALTVVIVVLPGIALALAIPLLWDRLISLRDVIIGLAIYLVAGHGVTVGYHRLFAHRGFTPARPLKVVLAAAGSMAVEGSVIGWVANHRRHHRFSDRDGDPHSPHGHGHGHGQNRGEGGGGVRAQLRGLVHAHVGWLFSAKETSASRFAPDLMADPDLVRLSRWWPAFALGSLALPFGLGWALSGTLVGAFTTFLWAGLVRMMLLHHVTWSVNSICHVFGARPFRTKDHSSNVALLGVVSMGESFHNLHHAYPTSVRHGVLRHQPDSSAGLIRLLERAGWATDVRWPEPARLTALLRRPDRSDD